MDIVLAPQAALAVVVREHKHGGDGPVLARGGGPSVREAVPAASRHGVERELKIVDLDEEVPVGFAPARGQPGRNDRVLYLLLQCSAQLCGAEPVAVEDRVEGLTAAQLVAGDLTSTEVPSGLRAARGDIAVPEVEVFTGAALGQNAEALAARVERHVVERAVLPEDGGTYVAVDDQSPLTLRIEGRRAIRTGSVPGLSELFRSAMRKRGGRHVAARFDLQIYIW